MSDSILPPCLWCLFSQLWLFRPPQPWELPPSHPVCCLPSPRALCFSLQHTLQLWRPYLAPVPLYFPHSRSWNLVASAARLSNTHEASLPQIFPSSYQTMLHELIFSPLSPSSFSLQGSFISHLLPSLPSPADTPLHSSPLPSSGFDSPFFSSHCCWFMLMIHTTPSSCCVHLNYSLPLLPRSCSFTRKKRPFIWHALLRLQALYCWIFPALTLKWSHSAPSISLPHYVPSFSLSVISTPSTAMTSLLLLTLVFLPSSIENSPYTSISFNLLSHNIQPS